MDANQILKSDILDIIFDGKNKEYGAYDLRLIIRELRWRSYLHFH